MSTCNCCIGSRCEPGDPQTCREIHGECKEPSGRGVCAVTGILDALRADIGDHPLLGSLAGGTYGRMHDIRDQVMVRSPVGRTVLAHNRRFSTEILAILDRDRALLLETARVLLATARYGRTLVDAADGRRSGALPLTPELAAAANSVGERITAHASPELAVAIRETLDELAHLVDLTPAAALTAIGHVPRRQPGTASLRT